ncbi:MAG: VOC family protein [Ilumatobacteraceae bacterium]
MTGSEVRWLTAFIDRPVDTFDAATEFWVAVTGGRLSPSRGERDQVATIVPPHGDANLCVQRLDDGRPGVHLDVHVEDTVRTADRALALGATKRNEYHDVAVMASPAGLVWCAVDHGCGSQRPAPTVLPDGTRVGVQQVCIDIAPDRFDAEVAFWEALTGWVRRPGLRPEYMGFEVPDALPLRLLLQRLDDRPDDGHADAHLDLFSSAPAAAADDHVGLGARVVKQNPFWIVMADPTGAPYCLIQRDPDS